MSLHAERSTFILQALIEHGGRAEEVQDALEAKGFLLQHTDYEYIACLQQVHIIGTIVWVTTLQ